MNHHQHIVSVWLEQIGRERGIPLGLGEDGHCVILCEEDWSCVVEVPASSDVPAVFMYLPLFLLPEDQPDQNKIMRAALEMNTFGLRTGGSQIALDSLSGYLILSFSVLVDSIDEKEFTYVLNDFLESGSQLRTCFTHLAQDMPGSSQKLLDEKISVRRFRKTTAVKSSSTNPEIK